MTSVNSISPVHIGTDGVSFAFIVSECVDLVCRCVGPEAGVFVDVVSIRGTSAWMVCGKAKGIEVLGDANDGWEIVVVCICWRGEAGFYQLPGESNGVVRLEV